MATDEYTYVILQSTDDDDGAVDEPNMARVEPAFQRVVLVSMDIEARVGTLSDGFSRSKRTRETLTRWTSGER